MSMYIQKQHWMDQLGGLVAAHCVTTEGSEVQDFSCNHSFQTKGSESTANTVQYPG